MRKVNYYRIFEMQEHHLKDIEKYVATKQMIL